MPVFRNLRLLTWNVRVAVALLVCSAVPLAAQSSLTVPRVPAERYTLPNGLTVLLSPDKNSPVVTVDIWYHVGSTNEKPGRTGFAHLFEHVMFQGSEHIPYGTHIKAIEDAGGRMNGSTSEDHTNYFETLPSNQLETALWLESDRMGYLLGALNQQKLDAQREVVKNERRQRLDNEPFGSADEVTLAALFPASNPYSWPVIGSMTDLSAASLEDVKQFFRTYYAPNNATLAVVGNFDVAKTKALIEKYFGPIARGDTITRPAIAPVTLPAEKRLVLEDQKATEPGIDFVWPTVGENSPDANALGILGLVLTQDRTSRLTKLLVYDRQLAVSVEAGEEGHQNAGMFRIHVNPRPNASLTEIERLVDSTVAALIHTVPPTAAEIDRFKNYQRVVLVLGMDGTMQRAELLLDGQTYYGDPWHYVGDLQRMFALTPAEVGTVATKYLGAPHVVLSMVPAGKVNLAAKPDAPYTNVTPKPEPPASAEAQASANAALARADSSVAKVSSADTGAFDRRRAPVIGAAMPLTIPKGVQRKLDNGTVVTVYEDHRMPAIMMAGMLRLNVLSDPSGKAGLGQVVNQLLAEGTTKHTADQLSDLYAKLGNEVAPLGFTTITPNFDRSLDLMAEELLMPAFPQAGLDRIKNNMAAGLQELPDNADFLAQDVMNRELYGADHPYSRVPTIAEVRSITRDDVVHFYNTNYRPPNIELVVAGDITPDQAVAKLNRLIGHIPAGEKADNPPPPPPPPGPAKIYLYDRPGAAQSVILIGQQGPQRDTPDQVAMELLNVVLGGAFNSRLNLNLREQHHFAYGAGSQFIFRNPPEQGLFGAKAPVATDKTDSAVVEMVHEIRNIRSAKPVTAEELAFAKSSMTKVLPLEFETLESRTQLEAQARAERRPMDYYETLIPSINAVTLDQVNRAASRYLVPDSAVIVVIGDRKRVEQKLRDANIAPVVVVPALFGEDTAKAGAQALTLLPGDSLSMDLMKKVAVARAKIDTAFMAHPDSATQAVFMRMNMVPDMTFAKQELQDLNSDPKLAAAVTAAGLTPEMYVRTSLTVGAAWFYSILIHKLSPDGNQKISIPGFDIPSDDVLNFVKAHEADFISIGLARPPEPQIGPAPH